MVLQNGKREWVYAVDVKKRNKCRKEREKKKEPRRKETR